MNHFFILHNEKKSVLVVELLFDWHGRSYFGAFDPKSNRAYIESRIGFNLGEKNLKLKLGLKFLRFW